jgi:3D (Asp-Asp-Asp) domain-containing protein
MNHYDKHLGLAGSKIQAYLRARKRRKQLMRLVTFIVLVLISTLLIGIVTIPIANASNVVYYNANQENEGRAETITGMVTAYTSSVDETDDRPFEMASGKTVYRGAIACPSRLEFGTRVVIQGHIYTCDDRMNARYREDNNFDIWMTSKAEAYQFGKQILDVTIVKQ